MRMFIGIFLTSLCHTDVVQGDASQTLLALCRDGSPNIQVVDELIASGAKTSWLDNRGRTALHWASSRADAAVIQRLIDHGAEVNLESEFLDEPLSRDDTKSKRFRATPLIYAARDNPRPTAVRTLLQSGAAIDALDANGRSAIMFAACKNTNPEVIAELLHAGARTNRRDSSNHSALDYIRLNEALQGTNAVGLLESSPQPAKRKLRYLFIPIHGKIGGEVKADVLDSILSKGRTRCDYVILDVYSPGGSVAEARQIAGVIAKYDEEIQFVSVIRSAISAAVLPALCSTRIYLEDQGEFGGAVSYNISTGSVEVDAKQNGIWAAELESAATAHGWSPMFIRPMVVMEEGLFSWVDDLGSRVYSATQPVGQMNVDVLDNSSSVLTISSTDAKLLDFPELIPGRHFRSPLAKSSKHEWRTHKQQIVQILKDRIAFDHVWVERSNTPELAMRAAAEKWKQLEIDAHRRVGLRAAINRNLEDAVASDPDRQSYSFQQQIRYNRDRHGNVVSSYYVTVPTTSAWSKWYGSTEKSISLYHLCATQIEELYGIEERCVDYAGMLPPPVVSESELSDLYSRASREVSRLQANRGRGPQ